MARTARFISSHHFTSDSGLWGRNKGGDHIGPQSPFTRISRRKAALQASLPSDCVRSMIKHDFHEPTQPTGHTDE